MEIIIVIFFSYLSGSIPFGLLLTKTFSDKDIRKIGSGNIGATNVLRSGNKYLAILTLVFDVTKGYLPILITLRYFDQHLEVAALTVFLGHVFPIWLNFKGGKGVATYLGVLFGLSFGLAIFFICSWILTSLIFRYSSVSSIFSSFSVLIMTIFRENVLASLNLSFSYQQSIQLILFIFFILIIFTHKNNISNLKNKTENKIKL